jgi:hypothetical protein
MRFCVSSVRSRVRGFVFLPCLAVCLIGLALGSGSADRFSVGFAAGAPVLLTQASSTTVHDSRRAYVSPARHWPAATPALTCRRWACASV